MHVGPCIPMRIQLEKAEVGPTSGPVGRLSHSGRHTHAPLSAIATMQALRATMRATGGPSRMAFGTSNILVFFSG
jgi:hypothetical protein